MLVRDRWTTFELRTLTALTVSAEERQMAAFQGARDGRTGRVCARAAVAVGVKAGQRSANAAVRWAAAEASRRRTPLHLVHVFAPMLGGSAAGMLSCAYLTPVQLSAERHAVTHELCALADQARAAHPGLETVIDVPDGEPATTLAGVANAGEQLVLGPGPRHPALAALWGRPGSSPLGLLRNPVVFVAREQPMLAAPITAVIHDLVDIDPVLGQALHFAAEWGCDIHVVCLPSSPTRRSPGWRIACEARLFDILATLRPQHPTVFLTAHVATDEAMVLGAPAVSAAGLLVIGTRRGASSAAILQRHRVRRLVRIRSSAVCIVPSGG